MKVQEPTDDGVGGPDATLTTSAAARSTDVGGALELVAATAEDGAQLQAQIGAAARAAARAERKSSGAAGHRVRELLDLIAGHTDRLTGAAGELRRTWAGALAETGLSVRQIATRLGVSHQRVSVLLRRGGAAGAEAATTITGIAEPAPQ